MANEINLTQTFDARVWAKEWLKTIESKPEIATDEDAMIGWFANAIMAGYDYAQALERVAPSGKVDHESYMFGYKKGIDDQREFSQMLCNSSKREPDNAV